MQACPPFVPSTSQAIDRLSQISTDRRFILLPHTRSHFSKTICSIYRTFLSACSFGMRHCCTRMFFNCCTRMSSTAAHACSQLPHTHVLNCRTRMSFNCRTRMFFNCRTRMFFNCRTRMFSTAAYVCSQLPHTHVLNCRTRMSSTAANACSSVIPSIDQTLIGGA